MRSDRLKNRVNDAISTCESSGYCRISHAHKGLSLFLKYQWCLDKTVQEPPFCPIDSAVLRSAGIREAWTLLDDIDTYESWMQQIAATAVSMQSTPAQWELDVYS